MFSKMKLTAILMTFFAVMLFSGCGKKESVSENSQPKAEKKTVQNNSNPSDSSENNLSEPTGKVDDIVDSAINSSEEDNLIKEEENQANISVDDSQETNDFGQSYDGSEF